MEVLIDKLVLIICCSIHLLPLKTGFLPVVIFLSALSLSSLNYYLDRKLFLLIGSSLYIVVCFFIPPFAFFLPLIFYDCFLSGLLLPVFAGLLALLQSILQNPSPLSWTLAAFAGVSFLLAFRTGKLALLKETSKKLRDDSREQSLVLEHKNKDLLERQDYEIHVATLKERNRIAREIHDHVGHMLSRSILQVGALTAVNKEETLKIPLQELKETLNGAMDSIRSSVHDLHTESIDLRDAMASILKNYESLDVHFDYDISSELPREIKYCYISILKEALSNVTKHSNATAVSVLAREHPAFYQLIIADNGRDTADIDPACSAGMGLENMKGRVSALHGIFRIQNTDGFKLYISIPK